MSNTNNTMDDVVECPLCMEPLEVDDLNFYPCTCGYQICRFCWHRIRTDENELCPACRKAYPENPADFTPLSQEQISALKTEKRQRDQQRKQKITENRKHLANVRVVQKNLVFVVGLPPRLADAEILKKHEYFGKYGKIHKVVINPSTTYAGVQGPSASAYVTYCVNNDALRAIQSVNNIMIDGRLIKTSLGTTKYCSHFMKNQQCPKSDCMYLHELGDSEASFTKEEMHQGKHQEYEKGLHDTLIAQTAASNSVSINNGKSDDNKMLNDANEGPIQNKDAWPCLSVSPDNKDAKASSKSNKENISKKSKNEKTKGKKGNCSQSYNNTNGKDNGFNTSTESSEKQIELIDKQKTTMSADEELNLISELENEDLLADIDGKTETPSLSSSSNSGDSGTVSESASGKSSPIIFPDHTTALQNGLPKSEPNSQCKNNFAKPTVINTDAHSTLNGIPTGLDSTASRFSKLSLFDDNNSFFSTNTFQPFFKLDQPRNFDTNSINSPQLPDLLSGTETNKDNRQEIDKLTLLKGFTDYNQPQCNPTDNWDSFKYALSKNKQGFPQQQDSNELLGMQELQKRNNFINSLGMPNFGGLNADHTGEFFHNNSDSNRFSQIIHQQLQQQQQQPSHLPRLQNNPHSPDNLNQIYTGNMSKFFDFHKNQQQQNQHQLLLNGQHSNDHINLATNSLLDNNRINPQYLEHTNSGMLGSNNVHKQRMLNKFDQLGSPQQHHSHNLLHSGHQTNRIQNQFTPADEDDLGFDPFFETQKGLAELLENEIIQQQTQNNHSKLLENCQRTRMPPPGFNHMNAFGFGVPRAQNSKVMPFMGMGNNSQLAQSNNWGQQQPPPPHQPQQNMNYQQAAQAHDHFQNHLSNQQGLQINKSGFGNMSDWTALDPAIVSFRQFPSFMPGPSPQNQQQQQLQQQQQQQQHNVDMYMPHLNPQQPQQNVQQQQQQQQQMNGGFFDNKLRNIDLSNRNGVQSGYGPHGVNLQNSIINQQQQQNSPVQVNANVQGMLEYLKNHHFL